MRVRSVPILAMIGHRGTAVRVLILAPYLKQIPGKKPTSNYSNK